MPDIRELNEGTLDDVSELFESNGATRGCYCMFFLLGRQDYYAGRRGGNKTAFCDLVRAEQIPMGLLAYQDGRAVGWVATGPRSRYPTAIGPRAQIMKQRDAAEDDSVWLVPCFFVRVGHRRAGITRDLLDAAVSLAQRFGAKAVEGFPIADTNTTKASGYLGKERVFRECGFRVVDRPSPGRVVMRRDLGG